MFFFYFLDEASLTSIIAHFDSDFVSSFFFFILGSLRTNALLVFTVRRCHRNDDTNSGEIKAAKMKKKTAHYLVLYTFKLHGMWHKAIWKGHPMRLELTRVGLLAELANHYTTRGAFYCKAMEIY